MNTSHRPTSSLLFLTPITTCVALGLGALAAGGCDGAGASDDQDDDLVEVPEVRASVELDELCALASELRCAGTLGCCGLESPYGSVDECMDATASCEVELAEITASEAFASGTLSYDPELAAQLLQQAADATAGCSEDLPELDMNALFIGSREQGEDCSDSELACAPGLDCEPQIDAGTGESVGVCVKPSVNDADDEEAAPETTPSVEEAYCAAPPEPAAPSNAAFAPSALSLNTHTYSGAGTNNTVVLHFIQSGYKTEYYCSINGINADQTKICTNVSTKTWSSAASGTFFWVENDSSDGVEVDSVAACVSDNGSQCTSTNSAYMGGTFDNGNTSMLRNTIVWAWGIFNDGYGTFWVDGNGNGNCEAGRIQFNNNNKVVCDESIM